MQKYPQMTEQISPLVKDRSYLHTVTAGAVLPLIQAGVSALAAGTLMLFLLSSARTRTMFTWSGVVMVIVFILTWLYLQRHWLTLTAEQITHLDLNQDGVIGEPETVRIEVTDRSDNAWHQSTYDFPASKEQMEILAEGVIAGTGFKEAYWTGAGAPFSQTKFRKLMAYLLNKGLIELVNEKSANQGYRLSVHGRPVFEHLAPPPPPYQEPE